MELERSSKRPGQMVSITDQDLILRLKNFEDYFVERKTSGDHKDWLKTVVGFANSAPIGYPAVLYIGVRDGGEVEDGCNLDSLQKTLSKKLTDAYPAIFYMTKVLALDSKQFLAVIVPGSEHRPHFAGPSYVRNGSETQRASEAQFQILIAQRQSKVYEILKWRGKVISALNWEGLPFEPPATVENCNAFYLTLRRPTAEIGKSDRVESYPLRMVEISFDHNNNRLTLEIGLQ